MRSRVDGLKAENEELKETNRDRPCSSAGKRRCGSWKTRGKIEQGEVEDGLVSLPEEKKEEGEGKGKR